MPNSVTIHNEREVVNAMERVVAEKEIIWTASGSASVPGNESTRIPLLDEPETNRPAKKQAGVYYVGHKN